MANKKIFISTRGRMSPAADTKNDAGGSAYGLSAKAALAQVVNTGTFSDTFYVGAETQLTRVLDLVKQVEPEFVAKLAVYARNKGYMKDMPAFLTAYLSTVRTDKGGVSPLFPMVFRRVIDNGRMLRTFVQIMRSGAVGRKSLGSRPKEEIENWFSMQHGTRLFRYSVGNSPSLADIIKMVHPNPYTEARENLYRYLLGKSYNSELLPELVQQFEAFKQDPAAHVPDVPFEMLTAQQLTPTHWARIAANAKWQMLRMNLNTFKRHGVFDLPGMTEMIAGKLRDPEAIAQARVFPYQLLIAYLMTQGSAPVEVLLALQDAMELAVDNVPAFPGKAAIFVDLSGSMVSASVTGGRGSATSKVTAVHVAALIASVILRKNPTAIVLPFNGQVIPFRLNPRDTVMTNAQMLINRAGGGTNCAAPLMFMNQHKMEADTIIYVSDNESWMDAAPAGFGTKFYATQTQAAWDTFKVKNPKAKLICIDLCPNVTCQAKSSKDVLNIGGFSDAVFEIAAAFAEGSSGSEFWVENIEAIQV